jgi:hypothetical protein
MLLWQSLLVQALSAAATLLQTQPDSPPCAARTIDEETYATCLASKPLTVMPCNHASQLPPDAYMQLPGRQCICIMRKTLTTTCCTSCCQSMIQTQAQTHQAQLHITHPAWVDPPASAQFHGQLIACHGEPQTARQAASSNKPEHLAPPLALNRLVARQATRLAGYTTAQRSFPIITTHTNTSTPLYATAADPSLRLQDCRPCQTQPMMPA